MKNKKSNNLIDIVGLVLIIVPLVWFSFVKKSRFEKGLDNSLAYSQVTGSASPVGKIIQKKVLQGKENFSVLLMGRASENKLINSFFKERVGYLKSNKKKLTHWVSADLSLAESTAIKKTAKLKYLPKKILTYQTNKVVSSEKIKLLVKNKIEKVRKLKMHRFFPRTGFFFWLGIFILSISGASFDYIWRAKVNKNTPNYSFRQYSYFSMFFCIFIIVQGNIDSITTLPLLAFISVIFGIGFELHSRLVK